MTTSDQAAAHQAVATAILQGCPAEAVYVADRIVVLANPVAAARWREEYGETFAGRPLDVVATYPIGGSPDDSPHPHRYHYPAQAGDVR